MEAVPTPDRVAVPLPRGAVTWISPHQWEDVTQRAWRVVGAEYVCRNVHTQDGPDQTIYLARYLKRHELAIAEAVSGACEVHHVDRDPKNNVDSNLEILPRSLHRQMHPLQQPPKPGRLKGVHPYPYPRACPRWLAKVGRHEHLGIYDTPEEAGLARDLVARELFGPSVYLNFREEVEAIRQLMGETE